MSSYCNLHILKVYKRSNFRIAISTWINIPLSDIPEYLSRWQIFIQWRLILFFQIVRTSAYKGWLNWNTIGDQIKWMIKLWNSCFWRQLQKTLFKKVLGHYSILRKALMIITLKHYQPFDCIDFIMLVKEVNQSRDFIIIPCI